MFAFLGKTVARFWPWFLVGWCILLFVSTWLAPKWDGVVTDGESQLLPADSPSRRAVELLNRSFPGERGLSNVVLILERREDKGLNKLDKTFISELLKPRLQQIATNPEFQGRIARIRTYLDDGGALLESDDHQASLVVVELTTDSLAPANIAIVGAIKKLIDNLQRDDSSPEGLQIAFTGSAIIGHAVIQADARSVAATKFWTVSLVVVLLLLIYRAPLLALIPLITVYVALEIALRTLAMLAAMGAVQLFPGVEIYVVILGYGAGVDYCLFLTARYKEELEKAASPQTAVAKSLGQVGAALLASAATVIGGIGMMVFARFNKFHEAGIVIPLSVLMVLLASLSLTPSLLCLTGRWAFWPRSSMNMANPGGTPACSRWQQAIACNPLQRLSRCVGVALLRRPGFVWLASIALLTPLAIVGVRWNDRLDFNVFGGAAAKSTAAGGIAALERHFPAGMLAPVTILIQNDHVDFREVDADRLVAQVTAQLVARKHTLGIADVRSLSAPLGENARAQASLADLPVAGQQLQEIIRQRALKYYVSAADGHVTRLDVVFDGDPFSTSRIEQLNQLEKEMTENLPARLEPGARVYVAGLTAVFRDLKQVTAHDRWLLSFLVPACIVVILIVLLRRPLLSVYLIVSVLFSYLVALGATVGLFWLFDPRGFVGLDWRVPIFLFTILVAVGEDYNIFLMTRVHEEQAREGRVGGITAALAKTGAVIASCGIIMAGTFGSLWAGDLPELKQMGFALAFGVLLDTLVVRTILLPAFLIFCEKNSLRSWTRAATRTPPASIANS